MSAKRDIRNARKGIAAIYITGFVVATLLGVLTLAVAEYPTITAFLTRGETLSYTQNVGWTIEQNQELVWNLASYPDDFYLRSIALSGKIVGSGDVQVYVDNGEGELFLIMDSATARARAALEEEAPTGMEVANVTEEGPAETPVEEAPAPEGVEEIAPTGEEIPVEEATSAEEGVAPETEVAPEVEEAAPEEIPPAEVPAENVTAPEEVVEEENVTTPAPEETNVTEIVEENVTAEIEAENVTITNVTEEVENVTVENVTIENVTAANITNITEEVEANVTNITAANVTNVTANVTNVTNITEEVEVVPEEEVVPEITPEVAPEVVITEIAFDELCIETCSLSEADGFTEKSYRLTVEIEPGTNTTLQIDSISYSLRNTTVVEEIIIQNVSYKKIKDDAEYEVIIDSATLVGEDLIVVFHHDADEELQIEIKGKIDYQLSQNTSSGGELVTLTVLNWQGQYFRIVVGEDTEAFEFGIPKKFNLAAGVEDAAGEDLETELEFVDSVTGDVGYNKSDLAHIGLIQEGEYDVRVVPTDPDNPVREMEFNDVDVGADITELVDIDDVPETDELSDFVEVYAIDPTALEFENATVTVVATGTELWKCADWNFTAQTCEGSWAKIMDIVPGQEYTITLTAGDPAFGETIQPSNEDAYIDQAAETNNYGASVNLVVRSWFQGGKDRNERALVKFDLSNIPQGVRIDSAVLQLYISKAPNSPDADRIYDAHRITNSWKEGTGDAVVNDATVNGTTWIERWYGDNLWDGVTPPDWATKGGDYTPTPTASATVLAGTPGWISWNITADVAAWHNGTYPNYGTLIKDSVESGGDKYETKFESKEAGANRPRLIINYTDITAPEWSNLSQSTSTPERGRSINLSAFWTDNINLSTAQLLTNETGVWNVKQSLGLSGNASWSNFTWQNSAIVEGTVVGWRISANDTSDNVNYTAIMTFTVQPDVTPPTIENVTFTDPIEYGENQTITADVTDLVAVDSVLIEKDGTTNESMTYVSENTYTYTWVTPSLGTRDFVVWANDSSGNWAASATQTFLVLDTTPPVVTSVSPANDSWSANSTNVFVYNVTDLSDIDACNLTLNGAVNQTSTNVQKNISQNFTVAGMADGDWFWNVSCADISLNTGTSETRLLKVDTVAPQITNVSASPTAGAPGTAINISANITDAGVIASVIASIRNETLDVVTNTTLSDPNNDEVYNGTWNSDGVPEGSYLIDLFAADAAGNEKFVEDAAIVALSSAGIDTYTNTSVSTTANVTTTVNATAVDTILQLQTAIDVINGSINIAQYSENTKSTAGLEGRTALKLIDIILDDKLSANLSWLALTIYYFDSELAAKNVDEASLGLWRWNGSAWNLVVNSTINEALNYAFGNVSNLSVFGIFGEAVEVAPPAPAPAPPAVSPGPLPPEIPEEEIIARELRAAVSLEIIAPESASMNAPYFDLEIKIKNTGEKPAENLIVDAKATGWTAESIFAGALEPGDEKTFTLTFRSQLCSENLTAESAAAFIADEKIKMLARVRSGDINITTKEIEIPLEETAFAVTVEPADLEVEHKDLTVCFVVNNLGKAARSPVEIEFNMYMNNILGPLVDLDWLGPFELPADDVFALAVSYPAARLPSGDYKITAALFEGGRLFAPDYRTGWSELDIRLK